MFLKLFLVHWFSLTSYIGYFLRQEPSPLLDIHQALNKSLVNNWCCKSSDEYGSSPLSSCTLLGCKASKQNPCSVVASCKLCHAAVIPKTWLNNLYTVRGNFPEPVNRQRSQRFCSSFILNKCGSGNLGSSLSAHIGRYWIYLWIFTEIETSPLPGSEEDYLAPWGWSPFLENSFLDVHIAQNGLQKYTDSLRLSSTVHPVPLLHTKGFHMQSLYYSCHVRW